MGFFVCNVTITMDCYNYMMFYVCPMITRKQKTTVNTQKIKNTNQRMSLGKITSSQRKTEKKKGTTEQQEKSKMTL